ncbi:hypothetical protein ACISU4_07015 [Streptomyces wuyuanensis]
MPSVKEMLTSHPAALGRVDRLWSWACRSCETACNDLRQALG